MTSVLFTDFGALSSLSAHGAYCLATDPGQPAFLYTYNATSPLIASFAVFAWQPCGFAPHAAVQHAASGHIFEFGFARRIKPGGSALLSNCCTVAVLLSMGTRQRITF